MNSDQQHADEFNELYSTNFNLEEYILFINYRDHHGLNTEDALVYYSQCHCCGYYKYGTENEFQLYCSERCRKAIEDDGFECIHTATCRDCLICNNSGRTYDENSVHPDFVELPKNTCDDCASEFIYPPFEYCVDDEVYNTETIYSVCNTCFCRNSSYRRRHVQIYPVKNHACHDPHVSALYCCRELKVFIDLIVREDLCQYMYEM